MKRAVWTELVSVLTPAEKRDIVLSGAGYHQERSYPLAITNPDSPELRNRTISYASQKTWNYLLVKYGNEYAVIEELANRDSFLAAAYFGKKTIGKLHQLGLHGHVTDLASLLQQIGMVVPELPPEPSHLHLRNWRGFRDRREWPAARKENRKIIEGILNGKLSAGWDNLELLKRYFIQVIHEMQINGESEILKACSDLLQVSCRSDLNNRRKGIWYSLSLFALAGDTGNLHAGELATRQMEAIDLENENQEFTRLLFFANRFEVYRSGKMKFGMNYLRKRNLDSKYRLFLLALAVIEAIISGEDITNPLRRFNRFATGMEKEFPYRQEFSAIAQSIYEGTTPAAFIPEEEFPLNMWAIQEAVSSRQSVLDVIKESPERFSSSLAI